MITFPEQLQNEDFRFVLLGHKSKIPFEKEWQNKGYKFSDEKLSNHINDGKNYGVIGGYGKLRIIDKDNNKMKIDINTFTVQTGSKGKHYYILSDYDENHVFKDGCGELRANNYQVVGPNCVHPNGKPYVVINDSPIKFIGSDDLKEILNPYIDYSQDEKTESVDKKFLEENVMMNLSTSGITSDFRTYEMIKTKYPKGERSEKDFNVIVRLLLKGYGKYITAIFKHYPIGSKYREHNSPDNYLQHQIEKAREYTRVECDEFILIGDEIISKENEKNLKNKVNYYLEKISKEVDDPLLQESLLTTVAFKTGISKKSLKERIHRLKKMREKRKPVSLFELLEYKTPSINYYVYPLIPKGSLILLGAYAGVGKSLMSLSLTLSMFLKRKFLGEFTTYERPKILYYDLENDLRTISMRVNYLLNGMDAKIAGLKKEDFTILQDFDKSNLEEEIKRAENYDFIILDSYRRFLDGNENTSEITDKLYVEFLKVLKDKNKTVLVLHHFKKEKSKDIVSEDYINMFRGSSDIPAQFDLMYAIFKSTEDVNFNKIRFNLSVKKVKNRMGLPIKNFDFEVIKDDNTSSTEFLFLGFNIHKKPKDKNKDLIVDFVMMKGEAKRSEIIEELENDINKNSIVKYLKELVDEKVLISSDFGTYTLAINAVESKDKFEGVELVE